MPSYRTVFISHAHADNARCARIADRLAQHGVEKWIDLSNLHKGHALPTDITRELMRRQAFVLLVTAAAEASRWVGDELNLFLSFSRDPNMQVVGGQQRLILPVRLEAVILSPDAESNWARVYDRLWIDGVGKPDEQVADEIAAALILASHPQPVAPLQAPIASPAPSGRVAGPLRSAALATPIAPMAPPTPQPAPANRDWQEIGVSARLYGLGFRGWRAPRTGAAFILPPLCDAPAGAFLMGSADDDPDARADEKPQSRIPVGAFAITGHPVTVAEYGAYLATHPGQRDAIPGGDDNDEYGWKQQQTRPEHPIVNITWFNARDYAAWLAQVTGQPWRLPTEAEWEKAARWDATQQHARRYPWGDGWDATRANTRDGGPKRTTAVGSYPSGASPYGAQDMAGNVWEWLSSFYKEPYPYDPAVSEDGGKDRTNVRVSRGGSWNFSSGGARAAFRGWDDPRLSDFTWGFRVARGVGVGTL